MAESAEADDAGGAGGALGLGAEVDQRGVGRDACREILAQTKLTTPKCKVTLHHPDFTFSESKGSIKVYSAPLRSVE